MRSTFISSYLCLDTTDRTPTTMSSMFSPTSRKVQGLVIKIPLQYLLSAIEDFGNAILVVLYEMQHVERIDSLETILSKADTIRSLSLLASDGSNLLERLTIFMKHAELSVVRELRLLQCRIVTEHAPPLDGFRRWRHKLLYSFLCFCHSWLHQVAQLLHARHPNIQVLAAIAGQPNTYLHLGWPTSKTELNRDIDDLHGLYKMLDEIHVRLVYLLLQSKSY